MFAGILAQHQPQLLGAAGTGAPAPAVPPSPQPPGDTPIAFAVSAVPTLFAIVGVAVGTVTLATVTCADGAMTAVPSETIPGLTFGYSSNTLTVSGTPTGNANVRRVVVSYIASDGSNAIRGSSVHEITVVNASQVLTIGAMANPGIRAGQVISTVLCSPSANYPVDVVARLESFVPSIRRLDNNAPEAAPIGATHYLGAFSATLAWTRGSPTSSGPLTFAGCFPPVGYDPRATWATGDYTVNVAYYTASGNVFLGRSTHTVSVAPASSPAPTPAPATPAPSPPTPSPAPAAPAAPAPGAGPDSLYSSVRFLFRFDDANDIAKDEKGGVYVPTAVTSGAGAVRGGGVFASGSKIEGGGFNLTPGAMTLDALVNISQACWTALTAPGGESRWCPVLTMLDDQGRVVWALGFEGQRTVGTRVVGVVATHQLTRPSTHPSTINFPSMAALRQMGTVWPNRYLQLCMVEEQESAGTVTRLGVWVGGLIDSNPFTVAYTAELRSPGILVGPPLPGRQAPRLVIGGSCPALYGFTGGLIQNVIPFEGSIDEVRGTDATRHASELGVTSFSIPAANRVLPWPNY